MRLFPDIADLGNMPGDLMDVSENGLAVAGRLAHTVDGMNKVTPRDPWIRATRRATVVSSMRSRALAPA
jgi:hypothetical protein